MKFRHIFSLIQRVGGSSVADVPGSGSDLLVQSVYAAPDYAQLDVAGMSVLIIEDNQFILSTVTSYLTGHGVSVSTVKNGQLGIETFLTRPKSFDAIFIDIHLPGLNGIEVARTIRLSAAPSTEPIPLVAISGEIPAIDSEGSPFDFFLSKPFPMESLLATLQKCALHRKKLPTPQ